MDATFFPPCPNQDKVVWEVMRRVPKPDREDAFQEAWQAHVEGRDVLAAVAKFRKQRVRHYARVVSVGDLGDIDQVVAADRGLSSAGPWDGDE